MNIFIILNTCFLLTIVNSVRPDSITCRNEQNLPIDWFSAYKLPKSAKQRNKLVATGTAYTFITETFQYWSLSNYSLNDSSSLVGNSINVLYSKNNNTDIGYILYNDQFGGDDDDDLMTNSRKAHAKGVLIFDNKSAIWLIHSIPNYPPLPKTGAYKISTSQTVYGQSILCLSVNLSELEKIGKQLLYAYPQVYDSFIPASLLIQNNNTGYLNNLLSVIKGDRVKTAPWFSIQELSTLKNNKFISFNKDARFDADLYANLIGPTLKTSLFTETWSHGVGNMNTNCSVQYPVYNIEKINMNKIVANFSFVVGADHSKWGVNLALKSNESKYVCIGDINRQVSQKKRGGGSVCFNNNTNVWSSYFNIIELTENCQNQNVPPPTGSM
jgi:deoxyribonuclease II